MNASEINLSILNRILKKIKIAANKDEIELQVKKLNVSVRDSLFDLGFEVILNEDDEDGYDIISW